MPRQTPLNKIRLSDFISKYNDEEGFWVVYEEHGEQFKEKGAREYVRKAGVRAGYDAGRVIYEDRTKRIGLHVGRKKKCVKGPQGSVPELCLDQN